MITYILIIYRTYIIHENFMTYFVFNDLLMKLPLRRSLVWSADCCRVSVCGGQAP